ncbi:putative spermidine/putrescine transport system ATP-binding protein [Variovorax paradoxus]|uniref:Spermidine/putrescine import ATP-binding protein PotA n=1 Tax=Variovorax paradoxus TaxID=34073 RepID=A0AAE3XV36_VARPD|nr:MULTISPECIES: ABC transporter ATP-binding protein [Variovorax]MBD9663858.1 ABC transporter ATP-binding protein [Variovorax sp. VRV01]MDR6424208.1 putative spermidine/putrescine transport system ATP-binding protein [Variovorax paradoxus]MDR6452518.1 putative spermidine/putrescine transport system ATP-binding protein [Variovorax paradoxus]
MKVVHSDPAAQPSLSHPQADTAVSLEGVVKKYHDQTVLHEVSLKIKRGEFLTLLGPSGCGKTTLLNLIAGFAEADSGEIFIEGQPVTSDPPHKRQIGIVFQNYALFPHMTVERNIGYGLRMRGVPKDEVAQRVKEAMAMVKLTGLGHRKPRELSGGQQQRVALARALIIQPKVLLLDEPFSALDKSLRGSMQVEIREIQRRLGLTTVFVTHDQGEALAMSDRIAVMSAGVIRQIASPADLYRSPQDPFVASFLGDVNILPAHYHGKTAHEIHLRLGSGHLSLPQARLVDASHEGERLDVYVRPEHILLESLHAGSVLSGTVIHHVFQGDHINTYVDVDVPRTARQVVTVRSAGLGAMQHWPVGSVVGLALLDEGISVFTSPRQTP